MALFNSIKFAGFGLLDIYIKDAGIGVVSGLFPLSMAVSEAVEKARDSAGLRGCQLPKVDVLDRVRLFHFET